MDINKIINEKFKTDRGYLYFIDLLKQIYPSIQINYDKIQSLNIKQMDKEFFLENKCAGYYIEKSNTIMLYTNYDERGNRFYEEKERFGTPTDVTEDELIETFLHELIHCASSRFDMETGNTYEGINMRSSASQNSYFIGLNEGFTQMITNDLLNKDITDAYPFQTIFARQLAEILGKENLMNLYFSNNYDGFINQLIKISGKSIDDIKKFVLYSYYSHYILTGQIKCDFQSADICTQFQKMIIGLLKNGEMSEEFKNLVITKDIVDKYLVSLPLFEPSFEDIGFAGIDEIKLGPII